MYSGVLGPHGRSYNKENKELRIKGEGRKWSGFRCYDYILRKYKVFFFFFFLRYSLTGLGFPGGSEGKESACNAGDTGSVPRMGRSPGEGSGLPAPVFLPGESHGQRSVAVSSP